MFDAILRLGAQKGAISVGDVALTLSISPDLAKRLFHELESRGYLTSADACRTPCGGCAVKDSCSAPGAPRLWRFTEKGLRAGRRTLAVDAHRARDARG